MNEKIDSYFEKIKSKLTTSHDYDSFLQHLEQYYNLIHEEKEKGNIINECISNFFYKYNIFYNKTSKVYFYYEQNYILKTEDNILHFILEFLRNQNLNLNTTIKTIIKNKIFKQIKENTIYETIPDTDTIQFILNSICPTVFFNKDLSKLFLIIIGNIILKKKNDYLFFMRTSIKPFLQEINKYISIYFHNINIMNYFKFKFINDHKSCNKILLTSNNMCYNFFNFNEQYYINLICISIYYSNRYSIHDFLNQNLYIQQNLDIIHDYFNENNINCFIERFTDKYISKNEEQCIQEKELIYLWKKYIHENDIFLPPFTSYNDFIMSLFKKFNQNYYSNNTNNSLKGYYSFETPSTEHFKRFWVDSFEYNENEQYFEINEILYLYNKYNKSKKNTMNETIIILILQSYYSQYEIIQNKFIHHLKCKLWNKKDEIKHFLTSNQIYINKNINQIYKLYCKKDNELKIGKKYFEYYMKSK